jgi:hypothetical protein
MSLRVIEPMFDLLHGHPRFDAVLRSVGLA